MPHIKTIVIYSTWEIIFSPSSPPHCEMKNVLIFISSFIRVDINHRHSTKKFNQQQQLMNIRIISFELFISMINFLFLNIISPLIATNSSKFNKIADPIMKTLNNRRIYKELNWKSTIPTVRITKDIFLQVNE